MSEYSDNKLNRRTNYRSDGEILSAYKLNTIEKTGYEITNRVYTKFNSYAETPNTVERGIVTQHVTDKETG